MHLFFLFESGSELSSWRAIKRLFDRYTKSKVHRGEIIALILKAQTPSVKVVVQPFATCPLWPHESFYYCLKVKE